MHRLEHFFNPNTANYLMKRVLIDTDGEFDDAMALILAHKSRDLKVEAITTLSGIRNHRDSTDNVLNTIELLNCDTPVAEGLQSSLSQDLTDTRKKILNIWTKGGRTTTKETRKPKLKPVNEDAVTLMIRTVMENPGEITLITLGALTNVAVALLREPRMAKNVKEVYTMGGAVLSPGNTTPVAEFNIWGDPLAAKIFYNSGMHIIMIGLEVYYQPVLTAEEWNKVKIANPATQYTFDNFDPWLKYLYSLHPDWKGGLQIGDALTVGAAIDKNLIKCRRCYIDVETKGDITMGQTVAYGLSPRHPTLKPLNTDLGVDSDWKRFNKLFTDCIAS